MNRSAPAPETSAQARIVFVNRFFFPDQSATSQLLTDLAVHLAGRGREVHVVTSRQLIDEPGRDLPADETVRGVRAHRVWTSRFGRGWLPGRALDYVSFYWSAARRMRELCRPGDVLVAKTDPPLISVVAARVAARRGAVLVNWLHDLFPEIAQRLAVRGTGGSAGRWMRRVRDWSLGLARTNVALGERMAGVLAALGVPAAQVRVIHNWADGEAVAPIAARDNPLRGQWGLAGRFVVGYSGNLGRAHDFEAMLGAAQALAARSDVAFVFVGSGRARPELESRAAALGLTNVSFRPPQPRERLGQSLAAADVHLVSLKPSLEGLVVPSKLYGILAAGRACIFVGAADGEVARILEAHGCGFTVAPDDPAALAHRIATLADDPALCASLGERARAAFERHFAMPAALESWRSVLGVG